MEPMILSTRPMATLLNIHEKVFRLIYIELSTVVFLVSFDGFVFSAILAKHVALIYLCVRCY